MTFASAAFIEAASKRNRGAYLDLQQIADPHAAAMESILNQFEYCVRDINESHSDCRGAQVDVGYTCTTGISAWVDTENDINIIGLSVGSYFGLRAIMIPYVDLWYSLFTKSILYRGLLRNGIDVSREIEGYSVIDSPNLEIDRRIVERRIHICSLFLLHHEFAHVWYGHTAGRTLQNSPDVLNSFEVGADFRAAKATLIWLRCRYPVDEAAEEKPEVFRMLIIEYVSSIYLLMRMCSHIYPDSPAGYHLPWSFRIALFMDSMNIILKDFFRVDDRWLNSIAVEAIGTGERAISILFDRKPEHIWLNNIEAARTAIKQSHLVWAENADWMRPLIRGRGLD